MPEEPAAPETGTEGTDPAPQPETPDATPDPEPKPTETVDYWKSRSRENEKRAKDNAAAAKELEKLKASMMSDQEKAVTEAEEAGRKAGRAEGAQNLAAARIEAALTGLVPDPAAIVEDLNLAKYVTDDGGVDSDEVAKLRAKYEALKPATEPATPARDPDFGARPPATQPSAAGSSAAMDEAIRRAWGR